LTVFFHAFMRVPDIPRAALRASRRKISAVEGIGGQQEMKLRVRRIQPIRREAGAHRGCSQLVFCARPRFPPAAVGWSGPGLALASLALKPQISAAIACPIC
jgi:hypothetical protein